jgi:hypothetical protein
VIAPPIETPEHVTEFRVALHVHFHYSELASDFTGKLSRNRRVAICCSRPTQKRKRRNCTPP